jgi:hypothetical protein
MPLRRPQGPPGLPFPLSLAGVFGVGLVVIFGILDGGQLVRQRVFEFGSASCMRGRALDWATRA